MSIVALPRPLAALDIAGDTPTPCAVIALDADEVWLVLEDGTLWTQRPTNVQVTDRALRAVIDQARTDWLQAAGPQEI